MSYGGLLQYPGQRQERLGFGDGIPRGGTAHAGHGMWQTTIAPLNRSMFGTALGPKFALQVPKAYRQKPVLKNTPLIGENTNATSMKKQPMKFVEAAPAQTGASGLTGSLEPTIRNVPPPLMEATPNTEMMDTITPTTPAGPRLAYEQEAAIQSQNNTLSEPVLINPRAPQNDTDTIAPLRRRMRQNQSGRQRPAPALQPTNVSTNVALPTDEELYKRLRELRDEPDPIPGAFPKDPKRKGIAPLYREDMQPGRTFPMAGKREPEIEDFIDLSQTKKRQDGPARVPAVGASNSRVGLLEGPAPASQPGVSTQTPMVSDKAGPTPAMKFEDAKPSQESQGPSTVYSSDAATPSTASAAAKVLLSTHRQSLVQQNADVVDELPVYGPPLAYKGGPAPDQGLGRRKRSDSVDGDANGPKRSRRNPVPATPPNSPVPNKKRASKKVADKEELPQFGPPLAYKGGPAPEQGLGRRKRSDSVDGGLRKRKDFVDGGSDPKRSRPNALPATPPNSPVPAKKRAPKKVVAKTDPEPKRITRSQTKKDKPVTRSQTKKGGVQKKRK